MNQNFNYQPYTRLPVKAYQKADQLGPILEVITPHKGWVTIELTRIDKGIFRKATELPRETEDVLRQLLELERDAKEYLLTQWLTTPHSLP